MWIARAIVLKRWKDHGPADAARKAAQTPPAGVRKIPDLAYLPDGSRPHRLDLFLPENAAGPLPVLIDVHGGGWAYGNKELNEYYCMAMAQLGFAVADINYTLAPEGELRRQVQDVAAAWNWVFAHGAALGCDPARVCVTGDSAGAQLALLTCAAAARPASRALYGIPPLGGAVRALCLTCPVACLKRLALARSPLQREQVRLIYGGAPQRSPVWGCSDPLDFLPYGGLPPLYILTCAGDTAYHWQAAALHRLLQQCGIPHVYRLWQPQGGEPLGHVFNVLHPEYADSAAANREAADFCRQQLDGAQDPLDQKGKT